MFSPMPCFNWAITAKWPNYPPWLNYSLVRRLGKGQKWPFLRPVKLAGRICDSTSVLVSPFTYNLNQLEKIGGLTPKNLERDGFKKILI